LFFIFYHFGGPTSRTPNVHAASETEELRDAAEFSDGSSSWESDDGSIAENRRELINAEYETLLSSGKDLGEIEEDMYCKKMKKSWERRIAERLFISPACYDTNKPIKIVKSIIMDLDCI